jgi:hypothetical protein
MKTRKVVEHAVSRLLNERVEISQRARFSSGGFLPPTDDGSGGWGEEDSLEEFFKDMIYDTWRDHKLYPRHETAKEEADDDAARLSTIYARNVRKLGVEFDEVNGGYADKNGFMLSLQDETEELDGREVEGNAEKAWWSGSSSK